MVEQADALPTMHHVMALNYDRQGRGDSGDTPGAYDVKHEIDDLAALTAAAGASTALFGWSSGAALALRAAASGRIPGSGE